MRVFRFLEKVFKLLVFFFIFMIIAGFCLVSSYSRFDQAEQAETLTGFTVFSDNFYTDNEATQESIEKMNTFVSGLSDNVSDAFYKDWKIIVSENIPNGLRSYVVKRQAELNIADSSEKIEVGGYSNWHLRTFFIKSYSNPQVTYHVFLHELGHFFDFEFGCLSATDEFANIYMMYKDSFHEEDPYSGDNYCNSSPDEFFATVFKEYFLFPEHLKNEAPEAYRFFETAYLEVSNDSSAVSTMKYDLQSALLVARERVLFLINKQGKNPF